MKRAKYTAEQIAQWFVNRSIFDNEQNKGDLLSNLKLQKLLYYAQGAHLALKGEKLFDDPIVAWEHGPVVESLYQKFKGNYGISEQKDVKIDTETSAVLEQVYNVFGQYSAWKLREMTHDEAPWQETARNSEISTEKIKEYFLKKYVKD